MFFDYSTITGPNVSSNEHSSIFQKGDLVPFYTQNLNETVEILDILGVAWANTYHSKVLAIPAVLIPDSAT